MRCSGCGTPIPTRAWRRLARRLGCSLSTVKRHMRKERRSPSVRRAEPVKPTLAAVLAAAADVAGTRPSRRPPSGLTTPHSSACWFV